MKKEFHGIIPPLVTPLLDNNTLDIDSLERIIENVVNAGVHGIFILGTTGEAQSLGFSLREKMIKQTSRLLKGRVPLLVGITDSSEEDSVRLADKAYENGADALVSAPPFYFATAQSELVQFYQGLLSRLKLPLFLYNMPTHTKVNFAPESIEKIAENKNVIGFKDSSANGGYLQSVIYQMRNRDNFSIFVGPEEMTAEVVLMGGDGGVNGGANLFPKLYVDLYNAAKSQNIELARKLQDKVMQISTTIYTVGQHGSSYLMGLKCAMSIKGLCNGFLATPFKEFGENERNKIKEALEAIDLNY